MTDRELRARHNAKQNDRAWQMRAKRMTMATNDEVAFAKELDGLGIQYQREFIIYHKNDDGFITKWTLADFFLPEYDIVVELDGGYHKNDEVVKLDKWKDEERRKQNLIVVRLPCEIKPDIYIVAICMMFEYAILNDLCKIMKTNIDLFKMKAMPKEKFLYEHAKVKRQYESIAGKTFDKVKSQLGGNSSNSTYSGSRFGGLRFNDS